MATTAKSKTTKTKPAKKPATKPAGASVKPKQSKTVKTTKPAKASSKSTTTSTKPAKSNCRSCEIFFGVIMIVLAVAMIAGAVACFIIKPWQDNDVVMVESGKGEQIATKLVDLPDSQARVLVPSGFKKLNSDEIAELKKAEASEGSNIKAAYANDDKSAIIYFTESAEDASDNDVKDSMNELAKIFKEAGIKDIKTNVKDVEGHTIGTMQFSGMTSATYSSQYTAFFSNNGKFANVAFGCKADVAEEWGKIGETIINSLTFKK